MQFDHKYIRVTVCNVFKMELKSKECSNSLKGTFGNLDSSLAKLFNWLCEFTRILKEEIDLQFERDYTTILRHIFTMLLCINKNNVCLYLL